MPHLFSRQEIDLLQDDNIAGNSFLHSQGIINYHQEQVEILPEIEQAVLLQVENAEQKNISIQLHFSPAAMSISIDRIFFKKAFAHLFGALLSGSAQRSVISVYVTDRDGKCVIEVMSRTALQTVSAADAYFRKYRITNSLQLPANTKEGLPAVYQKIVEDMSGELSYFFEKNRPCYFRCKFALASSR